MPLAVDTRHRHPTGVHHGVTGAVVCQGGDDAVVDRGGHMLLCDGDPVGGPLDTHLSLYRRDHVEQHILGRGAVVE